MRAHEPALAARTTLQLAVSEVPSRPEADQAEVARYVGQMAAELAGLARSARLDVLAYFLDMARLEAAARERVG